jgi:hypothetical protein
MSSIDPSTFYRSSMTIHDRARQLVLKRKAESVAPVPASASTRLDGYEFIAFSKQDTAFMWVDKFNHDNCLATGLQAHVFAQEYVGGGGSGARKYLAASYAEFWHYYAQMEPGDRCFYEVIRQHQPCHLYFDLEFNRYSPVLIFSATLFADTARLGWVFPFLGRV